MGATVCNIELEVRASFDLSELCHALGKKFSPNYCGKVGRGKFFLSGAVVDHRTDKPEIIASGLCKLVEQLSPAGRKIWKRADDRVFDVGLNANLDDQVVVNLFQPETIGRIGKLGARLAVSVYALDLQKKVTKKRAANNSV